MIAGEADIHTVMDLGLAGEFLDAIRLDLAEPAAAILAHEYVIRTGHSEGAKLLPQKTYTAPPAEAPPLNRS
ncbi:MAG: hypothetical protein EBT08_16505 [Betaproteobacteria bacterium]|nr:hypothetical protein [Betaproteobacteria bacterium]